MNEYILVAAGVLLGAILGALADIKFRGGRRLKQAIAFGVMGGFLGSFLVMPIGFILQLSELPFSVVVIITGAFFGALLSWRWAPHQD